MRPATVRAKISRAMKGVSNFQGKTHSKASKKLISDKRGNYNPIDNKKWVVSKFTGKTYRKVTTPVNYRRGRSLKTFKEFHEI